MHKGGFGVKLGEVELELAQMILVKQKRQFGETLRILLRFIVYLCDL